MLLNSHGGNSAALDIAAAGAASSAWPAGRVRVVVALRLPEGLFTAEEIRHGIHAGDIETSLMLAFRPDLCGMR